MLGPAKTMSFIPVRDLHQAKGFYEEVLGLGFVSEDRFAVVLRSNGTQVRVAKVGDFTPQPFTVLGWEVPEIEKTVLALRERGIRFEVYPRMQQDTMGIWQAPNGGKVAWFKDPDGNVLSITQSPKVIG